MSATMGRALPSTRRRIAVRALSADQVAVLSLAVLFVVLTVATWGRWGDLWLDSGYDLVAGAKVSHLDAPYLDYDYWYGPLGPLVLGGVFELFGIGIGPSVVLGLVLAAAGVGLSYAVARQIMGAVPAACVAALVAVPALSSSNVSYVQPHTVAAPLGMVLCLFAVLAVARFARGGDRGLLAGAGAALGLAALTRPETVGALGLALGGWLLVRIVRAPSRRTAVLDAVIVAVPAAIIALGGYAAFLAAGTMHHGLSVDALIHQNLLPRGLLRDSVAVVYEQLAPRTPSSFAALAAKLVLYGAGVAGLAAAGLALARRGAWRIAAAVALGLVGLVFVGVLIARPDTLRHYLKFVFAWMPAGAVIASGVLAWRGARSRTWEPAAQVQLLVALMLVGFSYSAYALYAPYPNPGFPQETAYAMPVIAIFLAWLHVIAVPRLARGREAALRAVGTGWIVLLAVACVGLLVHDARQESAIVRGPHGAMASTPSDAVAYQGAIDTILRETRPHEPILLAPQMTALYVMTGRGDILPQLSLLPGALASPADERAAIKVMEDNGLRLAIVDRAPLTRYAHGPFGVGYDRLIGAWLRRNFTHTTTLRGSAGGSEARSLDVWLRRTQ
jgi:dolichyl-phosphate-mannose-protein mannosyltransferase